MSIQEIETQRKTHPNFVAAVSDYELGRLAYYAGWSIDRLATDAERRGWLAAQAAEYFEECVSYCLDVEVEL